MQNINDYKYEDIIKNLFSHQDLKYRDFHTSLVMESKYEFIGIRTPILRKIGKDISKGNYKSFLNCLKYKYYEEVIVAGFVIDAIKVDYEEKVLLVKDHLKYVDNWASCDMFPVKFINDNKELFLNEINLYLTSSNPWEVRFALVCLLSYYVVDDYIDLVLEIADSIRSDHYYIRMANAWLIASCYTKFIDKTYAFFEKTNLDQWTINKAISKCRDSLQISAHDKEKIVIFRRKVVENAFK